MNDALNLQKKEKQTGTLKQIPDNFQSANRMIPYIGVSLVLMYLNSTAPPPPTPPPPKKKQHNVLLHKLSQTHSKISPIVHIVGWKLEIIVLFVLTYRFRRCRIFLLLTKVF